MLQILSLLEQIIDLAKAKDLELVKAVQANMPAWKARHEPQGDDVVVYHLKVLRDLIREEDKRLESILRPNDQNPNNIGSTLSLNVESPLKQFHYSD